MRVPPMSANKARYLTYALIYSAAFLAAGMMQGCASWEHQPTNADTQALIDCEYRAIKPGLSCWETNNLKAGCYEIWRMKRGG